MSYKAVFFDRDGVLTYPNPQKEAWRNAAISAWSGRPFRLDYEKMMALFERAGEGRRPWYRNLEDEKAFFKRYYRLLLEGEGVAQQLEERAQLLFSELWCNGDRLLFPETVPVLSWFRERGFRMGVISDTSPSLAYSLEGLGLGGYFESYTASSLVGAGKPDPRIYQAALDALGIRAEESLYVDDNALEADGARQMGFTAFHLDRTGKARGRWVIRGLWEMARFAEGLTPDERSKR